MHLRINRGRRRNAMRGLSLVELMVGVAVSLFIVAAAAMLVSSQLTDNRRLLLETQLQQDLRATADIITRDLRRAGFWSQASNGAPNAVPSPSSFVTPSPMMAMAVSGAASSSTVHYKYSRESGTQAFGFRLNSYGVSPNSYGVIEACQSDQDVAPCGGGGGGNVWQALTDRNTVRITEFSISTQRPGTNTANDDDQLLPCPYPCADGTSACWPRIAVRELTVRIVGKSRSDSSITRTLSSSVRSRNDAVRLSSEAPAGQACPPAS